MRLFLQQCINALALGGLYALTAVGYSLVYGVMELVNFSHGSIYMLGAYAFYILFELAGLPMWLSILLAVPLGALASLGIEKVALTPFMKKRLPAVYPLIATIGLSIVIQNAMLLLMSSKTRRVSSLLEGKFIDIGGCRISGLSLLIIACALVLMLALSAFLKHSRTGQAMRALAQNRRAAALCGIPTARITAVCFAMGGALAAVAGILGSMNYRSVDISVGTAMGTKAFAATVLGGLGSTGGAALGGFLIGFCEVFVAGYMSASLRDMAAYLILILILVFRPSGLFGETQKERV